MIARRTHVMRGALALPLMVVLATGCLFNPDKKKDPPDDTPTNYKPLTTISNVIFNLKLAYTQRNYEEYAKLFHPEYIYIFDPRDELGDSWPVGDELDSARNMFSGQPNLDGNRVTGIRLTFTENAQDTDPTFPDYPRVILDAVDLQVDTQHKDTGDPTLYMTPSGTQAHLYFIQIDETDPVSGDKLWKIRIWKDPGTGLLAAN
jgi:hypothetical protein